MGKRKRLRRAERHSPPAQSNVESSRHFRFGVPSADLALLVACLAWQDSLRAHLASAAAVALESAAEVDDAVDADLEDAKQATATATDQRTPAGAAPSETPIDTTPAPTMAKPKSKKEAYNLVQQLLNAGPGAAPNRKVLL